MFNNRYQIITFDFSGKRIESIELSSIIYNEPNVEEAKKLDSRQAIDQFFTKYTVINGFYQIGTGFVVSLSYTKLSKAKDVLEFFDSQFVGTGRVLVEDGEKCIGTHQDQLVFFDEDSYSLIFRRLTP